MGIMLGGLTIAQYIPSEIAWEQDGSPVTLRLAEDHRLELPHRPQSLSYEISIHSLQPNAFTLRLRLPRMMNANGATGAGISAPPASRATFA
jgi:hypothetical protein